jgi:hypothetical protein
VCAHGIIAGLGDRECYNFSDVWNHLILYFVHIMTHTDKYNLLRETYKPHELVVTAIEQSCWHPFLGWKKCLNDLKYYIFIFDQLLRLVAK